jgi:hypothetical protein
LRRYRRRWKVERLFAWLQNFRRLVVRYEYHTENFLGFVHLGCITAAFTRTRPGAGSAGILPAEACSRTLRRRSATTRRCVGALACLRARGAHGGQDARAPGVRSHPYERRCKTDESPSYNFAQDEFASHESVNHKAGEYVRGDAHINTSESVHALLKRGVKGERITMELVGAAEDDGHLRLSEFIKQLQAVKSALKQTGRTITGKDEPELYYKVVQVTHSSPLSVTIEPTPLKPEAGREIAKTTVKKFFTTLYMINQYQDCIARRYSSGDGNPL